MPHSMIMYHLTSAVFSWMRFLCDWQTRRPPVSKLPWLLWQQSWVHLLHPDPAWQRHSASGSRLPPGGRWHANGGCVCVWGKGGVIVSMSLGCGSVYHAAFWIFYYLKKPKWFAHTVPCKSLHPYISELSKGSVQFYNLSREQQNSKMNQVYNVTGQNKAKIKAIIHRFLFPLFIFYSII